ncbi:MAG: hypothetical protein H7263_09010 [Candidatus Sericytochromatia bacterium]|nr:hypothetical protein [Candidatus Sericytochromatia bacterium]
MDIDITNQILLVIASPVVITLLFQLSSYLNMTVLSTGMAVIEIEDFSKLTGIDEKRIRLIPLHNSQVMFKIMSEDEKIEIDKTIFNIEIMKVVESTIPIDHDKLLKLRKNKFAYVLRVPEDEMKISDDGNTFTQISRDAQGNEIIIGSVTFDENSEPLEVTGKFKKLI